MSFKKLSAEEIESKDYLKATIEVISPKYRKLAEGIISFAETHDGLTSKQRYWLDNLSGGRKFTRTYDERDCYVYFIASEGGIKIGYAHNPMARLGTLQVGNATKLDLIQAVKCKNESHAKRLEWQLHERFKSQRIRGEWFDWSILDDCAHFEAPKQKAQETTAQILTFPAHD